MRIIAGSARSLPLKTIPGMETRPTPDQIKETLFNMLQSDIADCSFLDLFVGSGQIGLEALSRGADHAVFVELSKKAAKCIEENIAFTRFEESSRLMNTDALSALRMLEGREVFDIIFMDPPYNKELEKEVLFGLRSSSIVTDDTLIIVEASVHTDFSYLDEFGFELVKIKKYKTNMHVFIRKKI